MDNIIKKICNNIVEQYKQDKNVLGIMLFGSAARDKFDKYSDVDIFVLLNKKSMFSRNNFVKDNVRVDIIFNTIKEVKKYLNEDKGNIRRVTSHMLAHGKILFQQKGILKIVQLVAQKNLKLRTRYKNSEILMHKYSIDDFWGEIQRDIKNKDYLAFGIDSHLLITNIIELFFKLKGEFLGQPNEMRNILKKLDIKFSNQVENFYKTNSIRSKQRTLAGLVEYIYKKSGGPLPKKWFLKN